MVLTSLSLKCSVRLNPGSISFFLFTSSRASWAAGIHACPPCQPPFPAIGNMPPICNSSPCALSVLRMNQKMIDCMKKYFKLTRFLQVTPFSKMVFNMMNECVYRMSRHKTNEKKTLNSSNTELFWNVFVVVVEYIFFLYLFLFAATFGAWWWCWVISHNLKMIHAVVFINTSISHRSYLGSGRRIACVSFICRSSGMANANDDNSIFPTVLQSFILMSSSIIVI